MNHHLKTCLPFYLFLVSCLLLPQGCSKKVITSPAETSVPPDVSQPAERPDPSSPPPATVPRTGQKTLQSYQEQNKPEITDALLVFYTKWRRTPYRMGGLSPTGIDCSGFTYLFFKQNYNIILPRTVSGQVGFGKKVSKKNLRPGDLVFFKTGFFQRHVGICMDDQRFAHASSSTGVMISRFDNSYWKRKYWKARRPFM